MNFQYKIEVNIEAKDEADAKLKIEEKLKGLSASIYYECPCDSNGHRLPSDLVRLEAGSKLVYYEPLCPYGYYDCILDPARGYLKDIIEKTDATIVTEDMYPKNVEFDGCGNESDDGNGNCQWYDDEDK